MKFPSHTTGLALLSLLASALAFAVSAQTGTVISQVTVTVSPAAQADAPIEIVGFKLPQIAAVQHPFAVVKNRSAKPVESFWAAAITQRADGSFTANASERTISLSHTLTLQDYEQPQRDLLATHQLTFPAVELISNCLHVAVAIYKVDFADGSTWDAPLDEAGAKKLWESSRSTRPRTCTHTRGVEETLRKFKTTGYSHGNTATHLTTEQVPTFTFTCPVVNQQGHLAILCRC